MLIFFPLLGMYDCGKRVNRGTLNGVFIYLTQQILTEHLNVPVTVPGAGETGVKKRDLMHSSWYFLCHRRQKVNQQVKR